MTITTQDRLIAAQAGVRNYNIFKAGGPAEAAGQFFDYWTQAGRPGSGVAPSVGLNGEAVDSTKAGTIPFTNASGANQAYLNSLSVFGTQTGMVSLYDRLWQNSGIGVTTLTAQAITPVALPARDENGASAGANVEAWLQVYTATGNGSPVTTITISYTNQDGTAGRTGTIANFPATAVAGTTVPIALQSGDTGVRSIQSISLGTSLVSGAVGLVLMRRLADIPITAANTGDYRNFFDLGDKLWPGTALCLMSLCTGTTAPDLHGIVATCEG